VLVFLGFGSTEILVAFLGEVIVLVHLFNIVYVGWRTKELSPRRKLGLQNRACFRKNWKRVMHIFGKTSAIIKTSKMFPVSRCAFCWATK